MFGLGVPELLIILILVLIFFGKGKISSVMGELGKGLKEFKKGMNDSEKTDKKD